MKQELLTDIELDVQEMRYLMTSFSKEPTSALCELLKRNIRQMQGRLGILLQELEPVEAQALGEIQDKVIVSESMVKFREEPVGSFVPETEVILPETIAVKPVAMVKLMPEIAVEEVLEIAESAEVVEMVKPTTVVEPMAEAETVKPITTDVIGRVEPVVETTITGKTTGPVTVLGEHVRALANLRQYISLNDSFRFSRELFGGDTELLNRVIEQVSVMNSLDASIAFVSTKISKSVTEENEAWNDFLEMLKKYFKSA